MSNEYECLLKCGKPCKSSDTLLFLYTVTIGSGHIGSKCFVTTDTLIMMPNVNLLTKKTLHDISHDRPIVNENYFFFLFQDDRQQPYWVLYTFKSSKVINDIRNEFIDTKKL